MSDKKDGFLSGLLFGALAGGAAYYIFGTEKGKKLQKEIKKKAKPYLDDLSEVIDSFPEEKEKLMEKVSSFKDSVEEKIEDAKVIGEELGEKFDDLPHIEELQKRGRAFTKRFFKNTKKPTTTN